MCLYICTLAFINKSVLELICPYFQDFTLVSKCENLILGAFYFMEQRIFYVYCHKDLQGNTFYIGKGTKQQGSGNNYGRAYTKSERSKAWEEKSKNGYTIHILEEHSNENYTLEREEFLIKNECPDCVNEWFIRKGVEHTVELVEENLAKVTFRCKHLFVNNLGQCFDSNFKKMVFHENKGYYSVALICSGVIKRFRVHRLVAEAFIPNPENKPYVNHIDCVRNNNHIENLEWCTQIENMQHASTKGRFSNMGRKDLMQLDLEGNILKIWKNVSEATSTLNLEAKSINRVANIKSDRNVYKNFLWIFKEDYYKKDNKVKKFLYNKKNKVKKVRSSSFEEKIILEFNSDCQLVDVWDNIFSLRADFEHKDSALTQLRLVLNPSSIRCHYKGRYFIYKEDFNDTSSKKFFETIKSSYRNHLSLDLNTENAINELFNTHFDKKLSNFDIINIFKKSLGVSLSSIYRYLSNNELFISNHKLLRTNYLLGVFGDKIYEKGFLLTQKKLGNISNSDLRRMRTYCKNNPK